MHDSCFPTGGTHSSSHYGHASVWGGSAGQPDDVDGRAPSALLCRCWLAHTTPGPRGRVGHGGPKDGEGDEEYLFTFNLSLMLLAVKGVRRALMWSSRSPSSRTDFLVHFHHSRPATSKCFSFPFANDRTLQFSLLSLHPVWTSIFIWHAMTH